MFERLNITISHHDITLFNDFNTVNPQKTEISKCLFLIFAGCLGVIE